MRLRYFLEFIPVNLLARLIQILPPALSRWFGKKISNLWMVLIPERKRMALENLTRAFGDRLSLDQKIQIASRSYANMALSMVELARVKITKPVAKNHFELCGSEHLEKVFRRGRGAVLVISHLGSWEYLSFLPLLTGRPWSVVVKTIKNPYVNSLIDCLRREMTVQPIFKVGSMKTILQELKANHGVAILIDQWAGSDGIWVDFFNEPTSTTSIPSRLAKKTGAGLVPAYCVRKSFENYQIQIEQEVTLSDHEQYWEIETTRKLNQILEAKIRQYPEQWTWIHRRWKSKPDVIRNPLHTKLTQQAATRTFLPQKNHPF